MAGDTHIEYRGLVRSTTSLRRDLLGLSSGLRDVTDGIYSRSGQLLRSAGGTHSRFVGNSPSVTVRWLASPHVSVSRDLSWFTAGPFIKESGAGENSRFVRMVVAYRV